MPVLMLHDQLVWIWASSLSSLSLKNPSSGLRHRMIRARHTTVPTGEFELRTPLSAPPRWTYQKTRQRSGAEPTVSGSAIGVETHPPGGEA